LCTAWWFGGNDGGAMAPCQIRASGGRPQRMAVRPSIGIIGNKTQTKRE
jgi:hypothetical protein